MLHTFDSFSDRVKETVRGNPENVEEDIELKYHSVGMTSIMSIIDSVMK